MRYWMRSSHLLSTLSHARFSVPFPGPHKAVWDALFHRALIFLVNTVFLTIKTRHKMLWYLDCKHSNSLVLPLFLLIRTNNLALKFFFFFGQCGNNFSEQTFNCTYSNSGVFQLPELVSFPAFTTVAQSASVNIDCVDSTMTWGKVSCKIFQLWSFILYQDFVTSAPCLHLTIIYLQYNASLNYNFNFYLSFGGQF